ncbi:MAG: NADP-dependent phosphogluconate dehydrogenase [Thermomicrobiales bacterium]|nr:NADP-dependent phosphogluconate dehydrogenase [Thermomicrobiales bacterium]
MVTDNARHVGLVGLAVMGENLARNIARNGFSIAVYNRTVARTQQFMAAHGNEGDIRGATSIEEFVNDLERPRRIILMVKAGAAVDGVIAELLPYLDPGDIIIDGGNSNVHDTERRAADLADKGFNFIGMGVSGGEEGALWGPSLMPGGPREAYDRLEPMLEAIAAKTDAGPCVTYIGPGGSGHYVKMVHNGIEYGDMQLIAETYDIMRGPLGMNASEMGAIFQQWDKGKLASYLIEVTAAVLVFPDPETKRPLVDLILDAAEQKGTGRWTSISALDLATPTPTIDAAVTARIMSSHKAERVRASAVLHGPDPNAIPKLADPQRTIGDLENALYFAKISSYAQGMALLHAASEAYGWDLHLAEIARIWKGGCIIRAALLDPIRQAFSENPNLPNLLLAPHITDAVNASAAGCRAAIAISRAAGLPSPAMSASLDYFDAYRQPNLPANLIQAQRDYFGAHTYRRVDREGVFHTEWATD